MISLKKAVSLSLVVTIFIIATGLAFWLSRTVESNPDLQSAMTSWSYAGSYLVALVLGLSAFLPVPAGTFAPAFIEAGLIPWVLIISMAIGTLTADSIGYLFGHLSRDTIKNKYPKLITTLEKYEGHITLIPIIILYTALAPFPNEILVIACALIGIKWRFLLIPVLLGNILHHTIFSFGFYNLFQLF